MPALDSTNTFLREQPDDCAAQSFDADRLEAYFARWGKPARFRSSRVLACLVIILFALPMIEVPATVLAEGHLRTRADTKTIEIPHSGRVRSVHSGGRATVSKGDTLLVLDGSRIRAQEADLEVRVKRIKTTIAAMQQVLTQIRLEDVTGQPLNADNAYFPVARNASAEALREMLYEIRHQRKVLQLHSDMQWHMEMEGARDYLQTLQAQQLALREQLDDLVIIAPFSGDIVELDWPNPGDSVSAGTQIAELIPTSEWIAEMYVPTDELPTIVPGSVVQLSLPKGNVADGRVFETLPQSPEADRTDGPRMRIRIDELTSLELDDPIGPGLPVTIRVQAGKWSILRLATKRLKSLSEVRAVTDASPETED